MRENKMNETKFAKPKEEEKSMASGPVGDAAEDGSGIDFGEGYELTREQKRILREALLRAQNPQISRSQRRG